MARMGAEAAKVQCETGKASDSYTRHDLLDSTFMTALRTFAIHMFVSLGLLLAFCLALPRTAAALALILQAHPSFAISLLVSAAVARNRFTLWWRAKVRQAAVGAKSRHHANHLKGD